MMTLSQIVKRTTRPRLEAARYVKLIRIKKGRDLDGTAFIAAQTYSTHTWSPSLHSWIRNRNSPKYISVVKFLDRKLHCQVSCSCGDFTFRFETALNKRGAAEIEYSNGEDPVMTNPTLRPQACKHIVRLYLSIRDQIE